MNLNVHALPEQYQDESRRKIFAAYRKDEALCMEELIPQAEFSAEAKERIHAIAHKLVSCVRGKRLTSTGLDAFLAQYSLSSHEGITLMCLAEALLRIPDADTADKLIRDKLQDANWDLHLGQSHSLFVNAATWALLLTGKVMQVDALEEKKLSTVLKSLIARTQEPVLRAALKQGMKILGKQFVMGRDIAEALKRAQKAEVKGYRHSYDMLGEAAKTEADASRYFEAYIQAVHTIGQSNQTSTVVEAPGISVKLSALYPRYELAKREDVLNSVVPRLLELVLLAKGYRIGVTIDAEEASRLDLSLDVIEAIYSNAELEGYEGFGLAVQSYQKRAPFVIDWLVELAKKYQRRIMLRLIKGAYWDSEIKVSQELGLSDYPVYTRKCNTDVSFIACAKKILQHPDCFYPQFATHNAYSVAAILDLTKEFKSPFEFQCLHGMGHALYDEIVPTDGDYAIPCRVYAPVGSHEDLLAYLVRRLLENGANSSFVNRIIDADTDISEIIADPISMAKRFKLKRHPEIRLPQHIYGEHRLNSKGIDLSNPLELERLSIELSQAVATMPWHAESILANTKVSDAKAAAHDISVFAPGETQQCIGTVKKAQAEAVAQVLDSASLAFQTWEFSKPEYRATLLIRAAELLEAHTSQLMAVLCLEAGKTLADAIAEVREAVDFCRYYAEQLHVHLAQPTALPGPTGEYNHLELRGRGIAVCISPWNFPLAIFIGQVSAALAAGNVVIAKPADQTALVAHRAVQLLHQAGIPRDVLQLLIGKGSQIGTPLLSDTRVRAVLFTGSTETAQMINQLLAHRPGPIIPFIAETGGQNAMIADSSALPEQIVSDVITSAFGSAGQRCSALRVLYVQSDVADKVITMLAGAMAKLTIGYPYELNTDIGPVIDQNAKKTLQEHIEYLNSVATLIYQVPLSTQLAALGSYFSPAAYEIPDIQLLKREVFGPILHIIRFEAKDLATVVEQINGTGYGLTLGIHSRINDTVSFIQQRAHVGNCYVNRSMIGAVVGVQPFGGEGLSGTGPKAGGPHYLLRLCNERTLSVNTAATGGNTQLVSLDQDMDIV